MFGVSMTKERITEDLAKLELERLELWEKSEELEKIEVVSEYKQIQDKLIGIDRYFAYLLNERENYTQD